MARSLGTSGYYVMLPNLYYRAGVMELGPIPPDPEAPERKRMFGFMNSINIPLVMEDTRALLAYAEGQSAARTDVVGTSDVEVELTAVDLMAIPQAPVGEALNPFYYTTAIDAFDFAQRVVHEREPPGYRDSNVGAQRIGVNADDGISRRRNGKPAERGPEQRRGRHQFATDVLGARRKSELIADEDRGPRRRPAGEEEVETGGVRRSDARRAFTASREVGVVELPLEDDAAMLARQPCARQCRTRSGDSGERPESWRARNRCRRDRRDEEVRQAGRRGASGGVPA